MVINLTKEKFIEKISEFGKFEFKGDKPAFIDFWAPWCGPCKMMGPVVEDLSLEYDGKVDVYKINTDEENELAGLFGIQSIPTLVFIPVSGEIQSAMGALPKTAVKEAFKEIFGI
jgi:thioredoxin